jgi:sporulation protein YlmC with PRC-barrel domain
MKNLLITTAIIGLATASMANAEAHMDPNATVSGDAVVSTDAMTPGHDGMKTDHDAMGKAHGDMDKSLDHADQAIDEAGAAIDDAAAATSNAASDVMNSASDTVDGAADSMSNAYDDVADTLSASGGVMPVEGGTLLPTDLSAEILMDAEVYGAAGDGIGEIEDVLIDADGQVTGITVEVGGFLGMGERTVELSPEQFTVTQNDDDVRVDVSLTEDQLKDLPEYEELE